MTAPRANESPLSRFARKLIVAVVGGTVLLIGLALIVLPGPAVVVVPVGLAILATEFLWARRLLERVRSGTSRLLTRRRAGPQSPTGSAAPDRQKPGG